MGISTGTGDKGYTSLWSGQRVAKASPRVEAYGTIDELNSHLGEAKHIVSSETIRQQLLGIQEDLFRVAGQLATLGKSYPHEISSSDTERLTKYIEELESSLEIEGFAVPGKTHQSAKLDVARTVARRAERRVWSLAGSEEVPETITTYLNRLSDLLYVMARHEE